MRQKDSRSQVKWPTPKPRDYRILLPAGWFKISLDPEHRDKSVDALVDQQFAGTDDAPHIKSELRKNMRRRTAKAYENGGIELYISLMPVGPVTIPASLLVTLAPLSHREELSPEELAHHLSSESPRGNEVSLGPLSSGLAVRVKGMRYPSSMDAGTDQLPTLSVDYHLPVPGTFTYMLLSFSTPLEPIAAEMAELFDAVADSFTWVE